MKNPFRSQPLGVVMRNDSTNSLTLVLMLMIVLNLFNGRNQIPPTKQIIAVLISFVIAITIHEFMHAYSALRLGDTTAQERGRVTFNPVSHFDPFGFLGMVLIATGQPGFGWGRPVPVNANRLRPVLGKGIEGRKRAMGVVAVAGPVSNIAQAAVAALMLRATNLGDLADGDVEYYLRVFLQVNVLLAAFNMIPIPPLDGHKILTAILPNFWYPVLAPMEQFGFMILFGILFIPRLLNQFLGTTIPSLTTQMIVPVQDLLFRILL